MTTFDQEKMEQIEGMKEEILANYPRLNREDRFKFACHAGLSCFGTCCGDVNIFLTPYDVCRLKNRLGISSEEFIAKYALSPAVETTKLPVIVLRMQNDEKKRCPFVIEDGACSVYEDRPTACRMYPVGQASGKTQETPEGTEFFFIMQDELCKGRGEEKEWTVTEWLEDQGINLYEGMNEEFKELNLHPYLKENELAPEKLQMYYMALYNLDMFRRFLYESRFFNIFQVEPELVEKMKTDDFALLDFAYRWLRFSLFGEKTINIPEEILDEHNRKMVSRAINKMSPK